MKIKLTNDVIYHDNVMAHKKYGHFINIDFHPNASIDKKTHRTLADLGMIESIEGQANITKLIPRREPFFNISSRFLYNELKNNPISKAICILSCFWKMQYSQWKYYDNIASLSSTLFSFNERFYDPQKKQTNCLSSSVFDCGNIDIFCQENKQIEIISDVYSSFSKSNKIPITIGGLHDLTFYILKNLHRKRPLDVVIFDAHLDCGSSLNNFIHCGNWVTHLLQNIPNISIYYYGTRDLEVKFPSSHTKNININKKYKNSKHDIYITVDVDYFDPSIISSVAYPLPDGKTIVDFANVLDNINFKNVIGADIVEYQGHRNIEYEHMIINKILFELVKRGAK